MAKTDTFAWRNNANDGDLALGIDGSDNLTFNGSTFGTSGAVNPGTATHLAYYASSTNAVSDANGATISGNYILSGLITTPRIVLTSATNQFGFHSCLMPLFLACNTSRFWKYSIYFHRILGSASSTIVLSEGTLTVNGAKTFSNLNGTLGSDLAAGSL